jgi:hypothetical protein
LATPAATAAAMSANSAGATGERPAGVELLARAYGCADTPPATAPAPLTTGGAATIGACALVAAPTEPVRFGRAGKFGSDSPCISADIGTATARFGADTFGAWAPCVSPPAVFAKPRPDGVDAAAELTAPFAAPVLVAECCVLDFMLFAAAALDAVPVVALAVFDWLVSTWPPVDASALDEFVALLSVLVAPLSVVDASDGCGAGLSLAPGTGNWSVTPPGNGSDPGSVVGNGAGFGSPSACADTLTAPTIPVPAPDIASTTSARLIRR